MYTFELALIMMLPVCCRYGRAVIVGDAQDHRVQDLAAVFPLPKLRDEAKDRREADRAVAVSAMGLAATGIIVADAAWPDGLA